MDHYFTIDRTATAEFKDRGSKFIAHVSPVDDAISFKKYLQSVKKKHAKAVHHCFAYRLENAGDNFRVSDDGEPSGTAGKPILGQIDSKKLTNIAVIVVRYFGGTLLGVPGLINAYKTSSALALQMVPAIRKQIEILYFIRFDYTMLNDILQLLRKYNCTVIEKEIQLFSVIKAGIPVNKLDEVLNNFKDFHIVEIQPVQK